jgi:flagellar biosynthesis/type III secretory pathway protein FliH
MTRALILEDFGLAGQDAVAFSPAPTPDLDVPLAEPGDRPGPELDQTGLDAFEQGYRNGWDDCIANETEERRRIGADLSVALSEMSLSAEEMRQDLLASLGPVLEGIATQLLPRMAAEAVVPVVVEEIRSVVSTVGPVTLEVLAAPGKCRSIERIIGVSTDHAVTVVQEPAYAEGQVSIRFGDQRRDIDLSDAAARMAEVIRAFAAGAADPQIGPLTTQADRGAA